MRNMDNGFTPLEMTRYFFVDESLHADSNSDLFAKVYINNNHHLSQNMLNGNN